MTKSNYRLLVPFGYRNKLFSKFFLWAVLGPWMSCVSPSNSTRSQELANEACANAVGLLFNDFSQKIRMLNNVVTTMLFPPSRGPSQIPESKHTVLIKLKPHRLMSKLFPLLITATIDLVNSNHNPEPPSIHSTPATIHSHHHP